MRLRRRKAAVIPSASIPSPKAQDCVSACLNADGHGLLWTLMYEWVYEADDARRAQIDQMVQGALWSTMHQWA